MQASLRSTGAIDEPTRRDDPLASADPHQRVGVAPYDVVRGLADEAGILAHTILLLRAAKDRRCSVDIPLASVRRVVTVHIYACRHGEVAGAIFVG